MKYKYIQRSYYLNKIRPFIGKSLIKVISGQRRVGKSYLLFQIMDHIRNSCAEHHIIYIDKEQVDFDGIRDYRDLIDYVHTKASGKYNDLFIDEIQEISEFEKALRHLQQQPGMDIYCTGSNADLLSGELATMLSGRYIEIKMYALSYTEFLKFHQLENTNESLKKYLLWGGLPYLKNLQADNTVVFEYLSNIYATIIYKDIIARYHIRNSYFLEKLVVYLANNTGNIISAKKISDFLKSQNLKTSPQIILTYLSYLQNAFLVFKVNRTDLSGKKIFEIHEKYYFEDWGIKNAIVGQTHFEINQVIENVIYIHMRLNGYTVSVGQTGDKEIDFIGQKDGRKIYIQAAYLLPDEKVKQREFASLLTVKDNYPKYVVSLDEMTIRDFKGVKHIHLREFLTENE